MSKQKERSELEYLRSKLKNLEKENRQLRKRIKSLSKKEHIFDDISNGIELENEIPELPIGKQNNICSKCNEGYMEQKQLADRLYQECTSCGQRTPARRT